MSWQNECAARFTGEVITKSAVFSTPSDDGSNSLSDAHTSFTDLVNIFESATDSVEYTQLTVL